MSKGWHAELELWFEHNTPPPGSFGGGMWDRLLCNVHSTRRRMAVHMSIFCIRPAGRSRRYSLDPLSSGGSLQNRADDAGRHQVLLFTTAKSTQSTDITVGAGGICEYLPQETIVFNGARAAISTRVNLTGDARYLGWDIVCLGRPACGERFKQGEVRQRLEIFRDQKPIFSSSSV